MSLMREWEIDPKAFHKSKKDIAKGVLCWTPLSKMQQIENMCSTVPLIPERNPFCTEGSIMRLSVTHRKCSSRLARILWNIFEITEVKAIGRKLAG